MTVMEIIRKRRSTRRFAATPIERSVLLELVEAGIWAPSGSNWQNQRFLIIEDRSEIERLGSLRFVWPYNVDPSSDLVRRLHPHGIVGKAAAVIVVFSDSLESDRRGMGEYYIWQNLEVQNCSAAIENMLLLATSMKLASCWVSASEEMNHTRLLSGGTWRSFLAGYDIPPYYRIQGVVLLGHPEHVDEDGFPQGEKKHGATIWQSTGRKPVESYLVKHRQGDHPLRHPMTRLSRLRLAATSRALRILLWLVRVLDRSIHDLEITRALRKSG